jgi:sarcosine oxidase subunit gamma
MAEARAIDRITITRSSCTLMQWDAWGDVSGAFADFAADRLGGPLPGEVGAIAILGAVTAVKAAPRRFWLIVKDRNLLPGGLPGELGAELDLSEGRERIDVRALRLRDVLAQCLAVDWDRTLDRATFAPMHRIPVMFSRKSAEEGTFVVPRTFAQSIVDWLQDCL